MRYAMIDEYEVSNGILGGVSLYVQGCNFHCKGCFNSQAWDFSGGKEWTREVKFSLLQLLNRPYIKRLSLLGGEPLVEQNLHGIQSLVREIKEELPTKTIWLYTGYTWEQIMNNQSQLDIMPYIDVLVDGRYIDAERDVTLKWRGSKNQRVINVQESMRQNKIILWCD